MESQNIEDIALSALVYSTLASYTYIYFLFVQFSWNLHCLVLSGLLKLPLPHIS